MGAVAADERQELAEELPEARRLIERGEYEAALDRLDVARGRAETSGDGEALGEIRGLARAVWRRALDQGERSATVERAARLVLGINTETGGGGISGESRPERPDPLFLVGGLASGALVWLLFGLWPLIARGGVMSSCDFFDRPTGWPEHFTAAVAAGVIGLVLFAVAVWMSWRSPRVAGKVMWGFPLGYAVALLVFCLGVAPAIWGAPGCVEGPPLFGL